MKSTSDDTLREDAVFQEIVGGMINVFRIIAMLMFLVTSEPRSVSSYRQADGSRGIQGEWSYTYT